MPRNKTTVCQHRAEWKAAPFERPSWTISHWQSKEVAPYAVSTLARDMLADGWRELDASSRARMFPRGVTGVDGLRVDRAFIRSEGNSLFGTVATLTGAEPPKPVHPLWIMYAQQNIPGNQSFELSEHPSLVDARDTLAQFSRDCGSDDVSATLYVWSPEAWESAEEFRDVGCPFDYPDAVIRRGPRGGLRVEAA